MAEERRRGRAIVLPVRLDVDPAALPAELLGRSCVDLTGRMKPGRYQAGLSELLSALNVVLPG